jgi:putative ABC transport system permease protein
LLAALVLSLSLACTIAIVVVVVRGSVVRRLAFTAAFRQLGRTLLVLCGVIIATSVVTSALVVGDSLRVSLRHSAVTQLGPVDEEVLASGLATGAHTDATVEHASLGRGVQTLPMVTLSTTVVGRDFVARVASAQVIEVDFAAAQRFGGNAYATGMSGPTPSGASAAISADLADATSLAIGHRVAVDAFGVSRTFTIDRILPRRGIGGLAPVGEKAGSASLNLFVPPGMIASMLRSARSGGDAQPVSVAAVFNGAHSLGATASAVVARRLEAATAGTGAQVEPVRQQLLADADTQGRRFVDLFRVFGLFSVVGGLVLLALTFFALTRDRSRALGVLRAIGLRRSGHAAALTVEGTVYAFVGSALGAFAGAALAMLVVLLARDTLAGPTSSAVDLTFAFRASTVAVGFAVGYLASVALVVAAAIVASRRNIVGMMRGAADTADTVRGRTVLGGGTCLAGVSILVAGLATSNSAATVLGPAVVAAGAALLLAATPGARFFISVGAVAVLVWSAVAITLMPNTFRGVSLWFVAAEGLVMTGCLAALVIASERSRSGTWAGGGSRGRLAVALARAYSRTAPRRTSLIMMMYAVTIFTLTLLVTIAQFYGHDVSSVARDLGGSAAIEVTSDATRPVPVGDVAGLAGVTHVTATSATDAQMLLGGGLPTPMTLVGFDGTFAEHGAPRVDGAASAAGDATMQQVATDPTKVIVGRDLDADEASGLPGAVLRVGERVRLRDPLTGITRAVTVAGLVNEARFAGSDHVFASQNLASQLNRGPAPMNLLYVQTAPGTNNDVVAAIVDGTHLPNGAYARSFERLANDNLSAQREFLGIGAGYATIGLLASLAGIGVVMVDRVRERRRQIAMLRAIGVRDSVMRRALRVESALLALRGTIIGLVAGSVLAWRLGAGDALGRHLPFSLPLVPIAVIVVAVVAASLIATSAPARRAGRLSPAAVLRGDE